ncbi:glycosyltransferase family 2 protein [Inquilinus limosus]|uniref:glycosyltransferase family 2 protein n=1 Tax=Inquilinus limosus TaxID=171674 RepID=UPI003F13D9A7
MPQVSVIIPTYNRAETIEAAVRSVLQQTFQDFEVLVVDDASTDDTVARLSRIEDSRLTVIGAPTNGGGARARNLGLERATAPLVAFQDSDDFWLPTKLASQIALLQQGGAGTVATFCSFIYLSGARAVVLPADAEVPPGEIARTLFRRNLISTQTLLARRSEIEAIGGFDPAMPRFQDWELCIRLAQRGEIRHDPTPRVVVCATPNSISTRYGASLEARQRIIDLCRRLDAPREAQAAQCFTLGTRLLAVGRTREAAAAFRAARGLGGGLKPRVGIALSYLPSGLFKTFTEPAIIRRDSGLR